MYMCVPLVHGTNNHFLYESPTYMYAPLWIRWCEEDICKHLVCLLLVSVHRLCIEMWVYVYIYRCKNGECRHTYVHIIHTCIYIHTHTHIHTYIHTYTCIHQLMRFKIWLTHLFLKLSRPAVYVVKKVAKFSHTDLHGCVCICKWCVRKVYLCIYVCIYICVCVYKCTCMVVCACVSGVCMYVYARMYV